MARLFFTLYSGIIVCTLAFTVMFELIAAFWFYDVDSADQRQTVQSYMALFNRIERLGGNTELMLAMQQTTQTNGLLLREVTRDQLQAQPELQNLPPSGIQLDSLLADDEDTLYFRLAKGDTVYQVSPDYQTEYWQQEDLQGTLYLWGVLFINAVIAGCWLWFLHRKLRCLERSALQIAAGDFSARAPTSDSLTVGSLNTAFNRMADRIEQLIASHKRLTNAVAHELRTPIFRLRCQLALLEPVEPYSGNGHSEPPPSVTPDDWAQSLLGIEEDLDELETMVDELLSYARMERAGLVLQSERLPVGDWLAALYPKLRRSCQAPLSLKLPNTSAGAAPLASLYGEFDPHLIQRALTNLVRNADRYARQQIELKLWVEAGQLVVCVDDDGCGIPEADRERVLEPFERLGSARDRQSGGHGLGLSIVREIMARHGGRVVISSAPLGGARVALYLPAAH